MSDQAIYIDLPGGGSVILELVPGSDSPVLQQDEVSAPFSGGSKPELKSRQAGRATLEDLQASIKSAMTVVHTIKAEFEAALPTAEEAEISFGISFEGKLDAKIVSFSGTATFGVKIILKKDK